jgi:hypothetical protein
MRAPVIAALISAAFPWAAQGQDLPKPTPTARDMYVACYLFANETDVPKATGGTAELFSGHYCALASISMIVNREGNRNINKYKFCLDDAASTRSNIPMAMAYAYIDYFEGPAFKDKGVDGSSAYLFAMIARWPCPSGQARPPLD